MIDPDIAAFQERMLALNLPPAHQLSPEQARANVLIRRATYSAPDPIYAVEDRFLPGPDGDIPVRIYRPDVAGNVPVIVYFHGGGWVVGDLESGDALCRRMANIVQAVVVSVNYRHAPEHRFPAAFDDAYAATMWVIENAASLGANPDQVVVCGSSAGGNLAAATAIAARDRSLPLMAQVLLYPVLDRNFDTPTYRTFAAGPGLTVDSMRYYWDQYLATEDDARNPYAAPLQAGSLTGVAPAVIALADIDVLRSEGEAYAERLRQDGVTVIEKVYPGTLHGFSGWVADVPVSRTLVDDMAAGLHLLIEA